MQRASCYSCALSASVRRYAEHGRTGKAVKEAAACRSAPRRAGPAPSAAPRALSAVLARRQPHRQHLLRTPSRRPRPRWCTPSPSTRMASSLWTTVRSAGCSSPGGCRPRTGSCWRQRAELSMLEHAGVRVYRSFRSCSLIAGLQHPFSESKTAAKGKCCHPR